ncbi:hypothetical protein C5167_040109 [Papaver somniferum]|uniref:Uncharacterized protein n=1 Tax=Papaver somniferum TaxID=3469 RepID=A0A4Y7IE09_PAPSO|nr:hypothetical protein C5167_040109 [Papaver somniferum]
MDGMVEALENKIRLVVAFTASEIVYDQFLHWDQTIPRGRDPMKVRHLMMLQHRSTMPLAPDHGKVQD